MCEVRYSPTSLGGEARIAKFEAAADTAARCA